MPRSTELAERTRAFSIRIVRLYQALPTRTDAQVIGKQLLRAGTSVGANYRAAQRGRSPAEFIAKLGVAIEEADEVGYWLQLLVDAGIMNRERLDSLMKEADELVSIFIKSCQTSRQKKRSKTSPSS